MKLDNIHVTKDDFKVEVYVTTILEEYEQELRNKPY